LRALHLELFTVPFVYIKFFKRTSISTNPIKQKKPPKGLFPDFFQEQASGGPTRIEDSS
jgi:hypothetical protein